jgi:hypothetical protein
MPPIKIQGLWLHHCNESPAPKKQAVPTHTTVICGRARQQSTQNHKHLRHNISQAASKKPGFFLNCHRSVTPATQNPKSEKQQPARPTGCPGGQLGPWACALPPAPHRLCRLDNTNTGVLGDCGFTTRAHNCAASTYTSLRAHLQQQPASPTPKSGPPTRTAQQHCLPLNKARCRFVSHLSDMSVQTNTKLPPHRPW